MAAENAARAIILDDGSSVNFNTNKDLVPAYVSLVEPIRVGARVTFDEPVILDYRFDAWTLNPSAPITADGTGHDGVTFENTRTDRPESVGGEITVASFNVLNYFTTLGIDTPGCTAYTDRAGDGVTVRGGCSPRGAWDASDLQRQQDRIVSAISGLDASVVGLMEIENSGALGEQTDEATASLVAALNEAAGWEKWDYVPSPADLPAAGEQDVITNALIFQPAEATPLGESHALDTTGTEIDAFQNAREPIGQRFTSVASNEPFSVVVNHFTSKGSAGPWPGDTDTGDGQGSSVQSRVYQAEALRDWMTSNPLGAESASEAAILLGDVNSYRHEDPLQVLSSAGSIDAERLAGHDESSYVFDGLSGSLDHVFVNEAAAAMLTGTDIWSINAGESVALEYSRYNYHGATFYESTAFRSSDHDPVVVGLDLSRGATPTPEPTGEPTPTPKPTEEPTPEPTITPTPGPSQTPTPGPPSPGHGGLIGTILDWLLSLLFGWLGYR